MGVCYHLDMDMPHLPKCFPLMYVAVLKSAIGARRAGVAAAVYLSRWRVKDQLWIRQNGTQSGLSLAAIEWVDKEAHKAVIKCQ